MLYLEDLEHREYFSQLSQTPEGLTYIYSLCSLLKEQKDTEMLSYIKMNIMFSSIESDIQTSLIEYIEDCVDECENKEDSTSDENIRN